MLRTLSLAALALAAATSAQQAPPPPPKVTPAPLMTPPPPPDAVPTTAAAPFMAIAGQADLFEIASSRVALQRSRNPEVRAFASMLIDHHTRTTNALLAQAKAAGLQPPPAALSPRRMGLIDQLYAAAPAEFDRVYLSQQVPAHEEALAVHTIYAQGGDTPQLRQAASAALPFVRQHLDAARRMNGADPR